ncbi:class I SAM-dependent DNA methyltransferase [Oligoflexus tunisiensis]|uniref:class I SAM-dependent DNA methyltransferase n=1 Tax=Oligoflexus tunisiensis TaxID=708132 RepID=UPI000AC2BB63|nr:DNA methyltransferase [Oligoflexus tunisiensis]
MTLSWNEIRKRAVAFSKEWKNCNAERGESQSFWNDFFAIFGISRRRVATFEFHVKKINNKSGYIDLFWPGTLLVEQKSSGRDLKKAFDQAIEYFEGLTEEELPQYILVSDFKRFAFHDLEGSSEPILFDLKDLHKHIHLFSFILGHKRQNFEHSEEANIKAAELMGQLRDSLWKGGYKGTDLEVFLARLMFCLFADDTGIFETKDHFTYYLETKTRKDGSDLGSQIINIFDTLDTPQNNRQLNLDEDLCKFPYVNGELFRDRIKIPAFSSESRELLLKCCKFNWERISPAIFGSMFQSALDPESRRDLGAHYTSERNILKVINPLIIENFRKEFEICRRQEEKLKQLLEKIRKIKVLDPACGCGNFLVITYRELRLLETDIHIELKKTLGEKHTVILDSGYPGIDVDSMLGFEILEFAAKVSQVALWIVDHQMNIHLSQELGELLHRIPLKKSASIKVINALDVEWESFAPASKISFIVGNPPFVGKKERSKSQQADMNKVLGKNEGHKNLDYVCCWFIKAARYIESNHNIRCAFVATNSVSKGEQVSLLWSILNEEKIKINFAYQSFKWTNEGRGKAGVGVVIIGFSKTVLTPQLLFKFDEATNDHIRNEVESISPYLIEGNDIYVEKRKSPLCGTPKMIYGNTPIDGGQYILSDKEKKNLLASDKRIEKYIRRFISTKEYLRNIPIWCIWLENAKPSDLKDIPELKKRIAAVRSERLKSDRAQTKKMAENPTLFAEIRQPKSDYMLLFKVSSERRKYVPISFQKKSDILHNTCIALQSNDQYLFGILSSYMHTLWLRIIGGTLEHRLQYSIEIVYNSFPLPLNINQKTKDAVIEAVNNLLSIRKTLLSENTFENLYDPDLMPPRLSKAHMNLDKAIERCYIKGEFKDDDHRISHLLSLYAYYIEKEQDKTKTA